LEACFAQKVSRSFLNPVLNRPASRPFHPPRNQAAPSVRTGDLAGPGRGDSCTYCARLNCAHWHRWPRHRSGHVVSHWSCAAECGRRGGDSRITKWRLLLSIRGEGRWFTDGSNGISVTALNNQTCPSPSTATDCYKVTVAQASAPLFFPLSSAFQRP